MEDLGFGFGQWVSFGGCIMLTSRMAVAKIAIAVAKRSDGGRRDSVAIAMIRA